MNKRKSEKLNKLRLNARLFTAAKYFCYFCYAYGGLALLYWFLNCFELELAMFDPLFIIPAKIVWVLFPPDFENNGPDYTLVIIGCFFLATGGSIDYIYNKKYDLLLEAIDAEEERLDREAEAKRQAIKKRKLAQSAAKKKKAVQKGQIAAENSKLLFLIVPNISKIKRTKNEKDLTFRDIDNLKRDINEKLKKTLSFSNPEKKGYYKNNLFLLFKDFNYCDDFISHLKPTIDEIIPEYTKQAIKVGFCCVFNTVETVDEKELSKELDLMDTVLSLKFVNEYIATRKFKASYTNLPVQSNKLLLKGEYNLSKNLSISKKQALYVIVSKEDGEFL